MSLKVKFNIPHNTDGKKTPMHRKGRKERKHLTVDIGASTDFRVDIGKDVDYDIIHESDRSLLVRLIENGEYTDVVVVRWGPTCDAMLDRDHISSVIASDVVTVPEYKGKMFFVVEGRYVSVSVRTFIQGIVLSSVMRNIRVEKLEHIMEQVNVIVRALGQKTASNFGQITRGKFKTVTAKAFIAHEIIREKLSGNTAIGNIRLNKGDDNSEALPVLCHRNLSPDHIILDGVEVVGIVGWSQADYIPEVLDRKCYETRGMNLGWSNWYAMLGRQECVQESSTISGPLLENIWQYCFTTRAHASNRMTYPHPRLSIPGTCTMRTCSNGDSASLTSLTNETIDTWEKSTVASTKQ